MSIVTEWVATDDDIDQLTVKTIPLETGGWALVWADQVNMSQGTQIRLQMFGADGIATGEPATLYSNMEESFLSLDVIKREDGGWSLDWRTWAADRSHLHVYGEMFDATGATVGSRTKYDSLMSRVDGRTFDNGDVLELSGDPVYGHHAFTRKTADGVVIQTIDVDYNPSTLDMEILPDQGWAAGFFDRNFNALFLQRYDATGAELGERLQLTTDYEYYLMYQKPDITVLEDGGFIVTWVDANNELAYHRFDADGQQINDRSLIRAGLTQFAQVSNLALRDGGWITVWKETAGGFGLQRFDAEGAATGEPDFFGSSSVSTYDMALLDDGGWVLSWIAWPPITNYGDKDVYQQRFDADGNLVFVNTAPEGKDKVIGIREDNAYTFSVHDFGYWDFNRQALAEVIVEGTSGAGTLSLNGAILSAGDTVDAEDISDLVWTPDKDTFGTALGTVSFTLRDEGNTLNGGANQDKTANSITFDVSSEIDRFIGTGRDDRFLGTAAGDKFIGQGGNDVMTGGGGNDSFIFKPRHGQDIIRDFEASGVDRDFIYVPFIAEISFPGFIRKHAKQVGDDVVIFDTADHNFRNSITLRDVDIDELVKSAFHI